MDEPLDPPLAETRHPYLPVALDLRGRPALIVGGGRVGTQKARDFAGRGARVTVVSPVASPWIEGEAEAGRLVLHRRPFQPGDCAGQFLVVVATDDAQANDAAFREADAAGQLVNVCDDPPRCSFIFASQLQRGPLTLSIFSHATSPALSRRARRELESWLGPEWSALAELMADIRPRVKAIPHLTPPDRQRLFERIVYSEALLLFREGRDQEALALADAIVREAESGG